MNLIVTVQDSRLTIPLLREAIMPVFYTTLKNDQPLKDGDLVLIDAGVSLLCMQAISHYVPCKW